jgi:hypothetical protein
MARCEGPLKRDGPRAPTAIHGPLGLKFLPLDKANAIAYCMENQFTPHDLYDENHDWRLEARVQALLDLQKLINSLILIKACVIDSIPNECLTHLPRRLLD